MNKKIRGGTFSQQKEIRRIVREWKKTGQGSAAFLLSFDFEAFYKTFGLDPLRNELDNRLPNVCVVLPDALREKLLSKGFTEALLQWFVPLERILSELDALTATGEISFEDGEKVLQTIKSHLRSQWGEELSRWAEAFAERQKQNEGSGSPALLKEGERKLTTGGLTFVDDDEEEETPVDIEALDAEMKEWAIATGNEEFLNEIKGFDLGDPKTKYLGSLPVVATSTIGKEEPFFSRFFALFALLDRHQEYVSEEQFVLTKNERNETYSAYQARMVMSVVQGYLDFVRERDAS